MIAPQVGPEYGDHAGVPFVRDGVLWQPTRAAVLRLDARDGAELDQISHPVLCDVHSAAPGRDGSVLLSSTGNEAVVELSHDGELRELWALGAPIASERDYRDLHHGALKPHRAHPNHAIWIDGALRVTCLQSAQCMDPRDQVPAFRFPEGPPHDGRLREGLVWFTTTNGHILGLCPQTGARRVTLDLAAIDRGEGLAGWCRGIEVRGDRLWVGLSQVRRATWRELGRRALRGTSGRKRPARIVELDWRRGRVLRELVLPDPGGAEIYGLTLLDARYGP